MSGLTRSFDETTGRIMWQTEDENGNTFSLNLGPNDSHDGLYIHIKSDGLTIFEYDLSGL